MNWTAKLIQELRNGFLLPELFLENTSCWLGLLRSWTKLHTLETAAAGEEGVMMSWEAPCAAVRQPTACCHVPQMLRGHQWAHRGTLPWYWRWPVLLAKAWYVVFFFFFPKSLRHSFASKTSRIPFHLETFCRRSVCFWSVSEISLPKEKQSF